MEKTVSVLAYGGGVDSTGLLVGLHQRGIPVDLILFADTGGELPSTMAYLPVMNQWLIDHGMPQITVYCEACKKAIDINDPEKVLFMTEQAQACVADLDPSFYGEMASYAYLDHRFIATQIIHQCSSEQIAAAPSCLLEQFATDHDFRTMSELVDKGISGGSNSARTLHMLTYEGRDSWMAESLLEKRMWVDLNDYNALHACVQNDALETARLLLDHGMDFERYQQWAEHRGGGHEATVQALADHWQELQSQQQDATAQGGMNLA